MNAKLLVSAAIGGVVGLCTASGSANAQSREETARRTALQLQDTWTKCLMAEVYRALPRNMSGADFAIFIKGQCAQEREQFRIKFADYLDIGAPQAGTAAHISMIETVISKVQEDAASHYVDLKTKPSKQ